MARKILVTGASGMVGSELVPYLQKEYGMDAVVAAYGSRKPLFEADHLELWDTRDKKGLEELVVKYDVGTIYHLGGLLSVGSEQDPQAAWEINLGGLKNVLDVARDQNVAVFWPSSIAAFGPTTPRENTPQHTILEPTTMYGVNKVAGELLCQYYFLKYGVDVRSIRYPGLIGYKAEPGNGTTEYSIHMFYAALRNGKYTCYLQEDTQLPMLYMDDAVKATVDLMKAPKEAITVRTSYNLGGLAFTPRELAGEIQMRIPSFTCNYTPDFRQAIADSWPKTVDFTQAEQDWGYHYDVDLPKLVDIMMSGITEKLSIA